jgi:hypothetical protein
MSGSRNRITAFARAMSTVLHSMGIGNFQPYGFFTPYRYAAGCEALGEDEGYEWLKDSLDSQVDELESFINYIAGFNSRFTDFREANPQDQNQPRFNQEWFPGLDAASAYSMVMRYRPARIIEVGSGHSTRFLAQAIRDAELETTLHSIDPEPRRHIDMLCTQMTRTTVTVVPVEVFMELGVGDILFIDGSHLAMPGTDVDYLFGHVLPKLAPGVVIHIHDIFLPNGYPQIWAWRGYTEQALLAQALGGGKRYQILCANAYIRRYHPQIAARVDVSVLPRAMETGFWLQVQAD